MKTSITEEMRFRQRVVEFAIKHDNNAMAARRYHTSRQEVQRWRKKYDGSVQSLANKSTRPKSHPNQHTEKELKLIHKKYKRFKCEGLAQVYRKCQDEGYTRSFESMCKQIKKLKKPEEKKKTNPSKTKYKPLRGNHPGDIVEIDVKFVPQECIGFSSNHARYYQITAIDLYSRKRVLKLVNEHSIFETTNFLKDLEKNMGFKIETVQTDNGREFCNQEGERKSLFEKELEKMGIDYKRTRPYSPWQNGVVERSHKLDNEQFYERKRFKSEKEMYKSFQRYSRRYNNIARRILGFKTPNEVVEQYLKKAA